MEVLHDEDMMNFTPHRFHQHQLPPPPPVDHVPRLTAQDTREPSEVKMEKVSSTEDEEDDVRRARVVFPAPETVQSAGLVIHGIKRRGAKSRVETQIKMRISLVQPTQTGLPTPPLSHGAGPTYDRIGTFRAIRLQPGLGVKRRAKKAAEMDQSLSMLDPALVLRLETEVWCTDAPARRAYACVKCVTRERKRAMSKSAAGRGKRRGEESESEEVKPEQVVDGDGLTQEDRDKIVLFNCGNLVELVEGECELPMRVTCYCRHHKEKTGFRIVMNLRDVHGRLVASGQTPTIMITDDHKTSGGKAQPSVGTTTDTGIVSSTTAASLPRARTKNTREPSASTEEERRARKAKPYDRKAAAGNAGYPHGLSMTPLNGRSIPGSPAGERAAGYFSLPVPGVQPGSGAVSPSLLMAEAERSVPNSPLGISDALPAISQRLSDWAAESSWQAQSMQQQQQQQYAGLYTGAQPTGLALNLPHAQSETLSMDEDASWAYASSEGGISQRPGSSTFSQDAFSFASPRSSLHGQERYGYSGTSGASDISVNGMQALRFEPEPDFESMLNLSPQDSPVDLPMDGTSPTSNPGDYQRLGWSPQPPANPVREPVGPKITRLVPMEGPTHGGIEVTILGENFYPGMVCAFGAFQALTVQTYGPTTIVCVLPPSPTAGQVPVHVVDPSGQVVPGQPIYFTYQDATDQKLMEMALTAVGLRVTGKVVGAVEIARRIMSAPGAGEAEPQQAPYRPKEQELADELAKVYANGPKDTQSALLKFLAAFVAPSRSGRRKQSQAALNHVNGEGQTILHLASLLGYDRLVKLLLRANATIDIHDRNGYSALAFAAIGGNVSCVKLLLAAGAKIGAYTFTNQTAQSLAHAAGQGEIVKLLSSEKPVKPRRTSHSSHGSLDADNPSSTDAETPSVHGPDAMSPARLTTVEDIAPRVVAKSDGTATPRARHPHLDAPPPYDEGASWLQRTLSHIPGAQMMPPTPQLKDLIPPVFWDKLPSAQLLIPHLPNLPSAPSFRPGEIMEQPWAAQAWLAVPIPAWMTALPKVSAETEPVPVEAPVRRHKTPTREREPPSKLRRLPAKRKTRYEVQTEVQRDKKPDRMLFLFWLPVLAMAFCYTIITAVPYAVGRALLGPVLRALRL